MRKVILRETILDDNGCFKEVVDHKSSYDEAEKIHGGKLDRRVNYCIIDGEVCRISSWTSPCSGCSCDGEYPCGCCIDRGSGCEECGYTGKRVNEMWVPLPAS